MNRKIIQKTIFAIFAVVFIFSNFGNLAWASARDCDGNAIIYCGVLTKDELKTKLVRGTGKQYQSSSTLKALFAKYGFSMSDIPNLKEGRVTSDNKVFVGGKVVATGVYTFGRHNIAGSTRVSGLSYPLYRRHPSVSFNSDSIDAFVYLNSDKTMAYAIIKSCGNIVQGVGKRQAITPSPTPDATKVNLTIRKYNDLNHDGIRDASDLYLSGWEFQVSGNGVNQTVATDSTGTAVVSNLNTGYYTITEVQQNGWESTTGLSEIVNLTTDAATQTIEFGNYQPTNIPTDPNPPVPNPPTGGGDITPPTVLASAGVAENIAIAITAILAMVALYYYLSKSRLKLALSGHKESTDPKALVSELRDRTKKRENKILKAEARADKTVKKEKRRKHSEEQEKRMPR